eukprot:471599-Amphidinium_carterae.1
MWRHERRPIQRTDLPPTRHMSAAIFLFSGFGFCGRSELCNEEFNFNAASVLRGECPCGGPIDWRHARGAQG